MGESRKQFETWYSAQGLSNDSSLGRLPADAGYQEADIGNYENLDAQAAWDSWKASRSALEINLPSPQCDGAQGVGYNKALIDCAAAIQAFGVRVKS